MTDLIHHASAAQAYASDPAASTFVSANAGTGKTKLLTDRVLRLLLAGAPADSILCVTYTRAAAAEMRNLTNFGGFVPTSVYVDAKSVYSVLAATFIKTPSACLLLRLRFGINIDFASAALSDF